MKDTGKIGRQHGRVVRAPDLKSRGPDCGIQDPFGLRYMRRELLFSSISFITKRGSAVSIVASNRRIQYG